MAFVDDHCRALQGIIDNGNMGETYNIGGNNEISNVDVATTICECLDELRPRKNGTSYCELIKFVEDRLDDFRYALTHQR